MTNKDHSVNTIVPSKIASHDESDAIRKGHDKRDGGHIVEDSLL